MPKNTYLHQKRNGQQAIHISKITKGGLNKANVLKFTNSLGLKIECTIY